MHLEIFSPPPPLKIFVKTFIYYTGYSGTGAFEKILPDGCSQLIIELDGNPRTLASSPTLSHASFENAWITGIQTQPIVYKTEQNATTLCIQFAPGGLFALTRVPAEELRNQVLDASLLLGNAVGILREQVLHCTTVQEIFTLATHFLTHRIFSNVTDNYLVNFTHQKLCIANQPLAEISRATGYSHKHFIRLFKKATGISPKKYQRIYRFNQALQLLHHKKNTHDIPFTCQFYDQAHFINEFRHFTGYTPEKYLKIQQDYPHVISINHL